MTLAVPLYRKYTFRIFIKEAESETTCFLQMIRLARLLREHEIADLIDQNLHIVVSMQICHLQKAAAWVLLPL